MKKRLGWIAAVALASVATSAGAVEAGLPPIGGTISIESGAADASGDASMPAFVEAATAAFTARGFTVINAPGHSAAVLELVMSRVDVGTGVAKTRSEAPMAMGAGVAIPLSNGGSRLTSLQRTRLEMRIRKRGGSGIVWDGVAVTVREAGTRKGTPEAVAADLSRALLQSYPAQSKEILGVP